MVSCRVLSSLAAEDVGGELPPESGSVELAVRRENAEVVEIVGGRAVVARVVLELAKVVQRGDLRGGKLGTTEDQNEQER